MRGALGKMDVRTAAGVACQQGFMFSLFYLGRNQALEAGSFSFERIDLLFTFLFMAAAFCAVRAASARARDALLAPTLVGWYAVLLVVGSLLLTLPLNAGLAEVAAEGALIGLPAGLLLCAWGRALGRGSALGGVPEVFAGTLAGAACCLAVQAVPALEATEVLKALPIGSAWALRSILPAAASAPEREDGAKERPAGTLSLSALIATPEERRATARLSVKIVAGTALFGLAGGFMETFSSDPGMASMPQFSATLLILVLFCAAALQLAGAGGSGEADAADAGAADDRAGVYRLALLVTMAGFLFIPVLSGFGVTGGSIVLAGYLGLVCVLMTLFLAMARAQGRDAAASFARGFTALYLGEAAGIALGNVVELFPLAAPQPYAVSACAGLAWLFAYLFLFTERDFRQLSSIVGGIDVFDAACGRIAQEAGLSKREAEVLPLALRGRTSERIAAELFVAKSTADTHLRRIYAKTGVHGRQELIDLGERVQAELRRG